MTESQSVVCDVLGVNWASLHWGSDRNDLTASFEGKVVLVTWKWERREDGGNYNKKQEIHKIKYQIQFSSSHKACSTFYLTIMNTHMQYSKHN